MRSARFIRVFQPGVLVPLFLTATFAADVLLRAVPLERVSYRVWEALRTFGAEQPFRPNARYERPRVYGNLAALGNQPDLRQYHPILFTTDSLGFPNAPALAAGGRADALLFGSSFSAGTEVSAGEGLAAQLSAVTGQVVYSAAPSDPAPVLAGALARHLRMRHPIVMFEYFEGNELPRIDAVTQNPAVLRCRVVLGIWDSPRRCAALTRLYELREVSRLQVFAARAYRRAEDDFLLPNMAGRRVIRAPLRDGSEMLFLAAERDTYHRQRSTDPAVRYFTWLRNRLALQDQRLVVVLAPQKYTVYAPLLATPDTGPDASIVYLRELERRLRGQGITTVNLVGPLRAAANAALDRDSLVYWRDDTHWNAAGTAVAARAIAPLLVSASRRTTALARP